MSELFIREKDGKKAGRVCLAGNGRDSRLIDRAPYFRRYKRWVDGAGGSDLAHTKTGPELAEYICGNYMRKCTYTDTNDE